MFLSCVAIIAALLCGCSRAQSSAESKANGQKPSPPPPSVMRTVKVKFDYDFSRFPPCSAKITKKCVQQFNVYDVTARPPIFLFSIPVPPKARGMVKGITGSAPQKHSFPTGPRRFGVTAKGPGLNYESDPYLATTVVEVLPDSAPSSTPSTSNVPGRSAPKK